MSILIIIGLLGWVALLISIYIFIKIRYEKKIIKKVSLREICEPKVVVIGGGTGQSIFLRGLKHLTRNITAVVTVADDGGGSGVLREDLGMLPPGDIRNCLLALANIEPTMNEVMKYRFTEGALKGQSFGNLFLAAMNGLYGNFETAVYKMSEIFAITGKVLPVSLEDINLVARLKNGNLVKGESNIEKEVINQKSTIDKIYLDPKIAKPLEEVINSIAEADIIIMGPGSLYTSIIPNLLVDKVVDAIKKSEVPKIYICNIMTQPGETDKHNVLDHINAIIKHSKSNIIDYVVVNNEVLPDQVFSKYKKKGSDQVILDDGQRKEIESLGINIVEDNLVEVKSNYIRHDANYMSNIVVNLALSHKYNKDI